VRAAALHLAEVKEEVRPWRRSRMSRRRSCRSWRSGCNLRTPWRIRCKRRSIPRWSSRGRRAGAGTRARCQTLRTSCGRAVMARAGPVHDGEGRLAAHPLRPARVSRPRLQLHICLVRRPRLRAPAPVREAGATLRERARGRLLPHPLAHPPHLRPTAHAPPRQDHTRVR
jgi:hypothetical protein